LGLGGMSREVDLRAEALLRRKFKL
jgi:hypothetical protein